MPKWPLNAHAYISILLYKCMCIGVDDLQDVKTEVFDIASRWDSFALALGLRNPAIEQIKTDNSGRYSTL